jgi:hypothetical protein
MANKAKKQVISKEKNKDSDDVKVIGENGNGTYKIHLRNAEDIRRLLSSTINELRRKQISIDRAKAIGYLSNIMLAVFEQGDLADRLKALEERSNY